MVLFRYVQWGQHQRHRLIAWQYYSLRPLATIYEASLRLDSRNDKKRKRSPRPNTHQDPV